ncbi:MAG: PP2C family protein-serine/threonine phosphatase [Sodaliphilus sp.]
MSNFTQSQKWQCALSVDSRQGGREENQDCYGYKETTYGFLVVVCDGMGGGPAGAYASSIAVQSIIQEVDEAAPNQNPEQVLRNAVTATNLLVRRTVKEQPKLMGMGTTCVAALISAGKASVAHVGDSRCYLLRNGKSEFRTADHSVVGEMVRNGELSEEDARRAKNSNVITRAIGITDIIEVDTHTVKIKPGDRIALCTDGVWGMLPEPEVIEFLSQKQSVDTILPNLLNSIDAMGKNKPNGNYDNLTLALVQILRPEAADKPKPQRSVWKYAIALVLLLSIGINAYFFLKNHNPKSAASSENQPAANAESNSDTNNDGDDERLQREFALRRAQDFRDSVLQAQKQLVEKSAQQTPHTMAPEHIKLLNKIVKNVESLKTGKGGDLKGKRETIRIIIKDFNKLKKHLENSKIRHKGIEEISTRIQKHQDILVETQPNGASTDRAKEEIDKVIKSLKALK